MTPIRIFRSALFGTMVLAVAASSTRPPALAGDRICAAPRVPSSAKGGYGTVSFANSCKPAVQPALQREIARLHSFEAEPSAFAAVARRDPGCAIAWWGAAMSARGNPLGGSLDAKSLATGRKLVDRALAVSGASPREKALIAAMDTYYRPYAGQIDRARAYAEKMDAVRAAYPADPDVAALDGLAIIEGVDLTDKTYARQKRAGAILEAVMAAHPQNPGAPHYLIHAYDYTALAPQAVHAAEVESRIAPASSHAQHMPAHIWSMLGEWDRSIAANRRSEFVADPSSAHRPVAGDIVYRHAFDFIAYARLQKGQDGQVGADLAALQEKGGMPTIVLARYMLERSDWVNATRVPVPEREPFDAALARFTRAYGAARAGDTGKAAAELAALRALRGSVVDWAGEYWGVFVDIWAETAEAWLLKAQGRDAEALKLMESAAARDDGHEKHIYLENKILPARESQGDMLLALGRPKEALDAYAASLKLAPNRYRAFLGAAEAAEAAGDRDAARVWWTKLVALSQDGDKARPGFAEAQHFLAGKG